MSKLSSGEEFVSPDFSDLDSSRKLTDAGWQGSAKEPVIDWKDNLGFLEGQQLTVIARNDQKNGVQDFYNHKGDVEVPNSVVGVLWKKVYQLHDGKWEMIKE